MAETSTCPAAPPGYLGTGQCPQSRTLCDTWAEGEEMVSPAARVEQDLGSGSKDKSPSNLELFSDLSISTVNLEDK